MGLPSFEVKEPVVEMDNDISWHCVLEAKEASTSSLSRTFRKCKIQSEAYSLRALRYTSQSFFNDVSLSASIRVSLSRLFSQLTFVMTYCSHLFRKAANGDPNALVYPETFFMEFDLQPKTTGKE